jgi:Flp pilus assembly protein TadG
MALRRLGRDRSGVAYIEMALLAPVLLLMYCGAYVVSDMVTCGRKVSLAAHTITDLTSQYSTVSAASLTAILANSAYVMAPYNSSSAGLRVSEIQITGASTAVVVWSQAQNATPLAVNTAVTLPANMAPTLMQPTTTGAGNGAYMIMGEISYPYTPGFGQGWLPAPNLYNRYFMLPRISTSIPTPT